MASAALALTLGVPAAATAAPRTADDAFTKAPSHGRASAKITPRVLDPDRKINVMVELGGDPVAVAQAKADRTFSSAERKAVKQKLRKAQDAISGDITAKGGKVYSHLQSAYNGMGVRIAAGKADALAKLPGVVAVHTLTPKSVDNTVSVPYLGVPQVWQDTGYTGKGVKVAIIDSGIDYTHADFGGPGTVAAWDAAHAASAAEADPALFGPDAPRVKGGYDFVGDNYDANGEKGPTTPSPDPNPLDCLGHGSHVAGTAGGSGVTADGKTYTGPYNADTAKAAFKVGPGVAPQVDLYSLKVFGCDGSTDVTVDAIDWAVDHGMDVINMSLGSPFGSPSDPDAVAASNAVAAGVVVVASSGNEGQNPYMTGTPGSGRGVVSVAAVDSTETFPGASLSSGATSVDAINANGAKLTGASYPVFVVKDDPTSPQNEALGCSVDAFEGIAAGQLAVVDRGTCARAAKAIFGQQAGAGAVVMINNANGFPPYEGEITSNPDDGTPYTVTIPFLGVRGEDAAAVRDLDTKTLTVADAILKNPGFGDYASFSSSGPASADSSMKPNVSAPGVSISSAGVGTGNEAAINSGTSMAAPHVAGVAALAVQAHPTWRADDIAATLGSTADPDQLKAYAPLLGGGLVDAAQSVATTTFATGDTFRTDNGRIAAPSLSFGFDEPSVASVETKVVTITNRGTKPVTYKVSADPFDGSVKAKVRFSAKQVRVPANGSARVAVTLLVPATTIGSSLDENDPFGFRQVSGNVVLTSSKGVLRVPYLQVPRAQAHVVADLARSHGGPYGASVNSMGKPGQPAGPLAVRLANPFGALDTDADFYTWGLSDGRDATPGAGSTGYDLRAAGVQSFDIGSDKLLVFALNLHDRYSNAASNEYDVPVDTNGDGKADWVVVAYDSGAFNTGEYNGLTEVLVTNVKTNETISSKYMAVAPTDSSTLLLPVKASALGLTSAAGAFRYSAASFGGYGGEDEFSGWASYNPWAKAIADGDYVTVERNKTAEVSVAVDPANLATQKPKGLMVVVFDNKSGAPEAQLLGIR